MIKAAEGSTRQLLQFCIGYFLFYVITGLAVKYFTGSAADGLPGMTNLEYLVYSTLGVALVMTGVVIACRWYRLESLRRVSFLGLSLPVELFYIVPSGICMAVIIPTATLMYMLPISVMVAMVIMHGAVMVAGRLIDAIQTRQGILKKRVYAVENWAVVFALLAVAMPIATLKGGEFDFLKSPLALLILGSYITAYSIRIYIMNYFKNTTTYKNGNQTFFGVEQLTAGLALLVVGIILYKGLDWFGWNNLFIHNYHAAVIAPKPLWGWATIAGTSFGAASFFSVFLFMFKGRTATFAGLVNRLTSLMGGIAATLIFHFGFGGKMPKREDWLSLSCILIAVIFLNRAEKKRIKELIQTRELVLNEDEPHIVF